MINPSIYPLQLRLATLALATLALAPQARADQLTVEWLTQYSTGIYESANSIAVDALGQSWVGGYIYTPSGDANMTLSRLSPGGSVDFVRQRGGTGDDYGSSVALGGSGAVFIGGSSRSNTFDGAAAQGGWDGLSMRYDASGAWQATTRFGSSTDQYVDNLAANATHLLISGMTEGSFDGQTYLAGSDAFLTKRDSNGSLVWTRFASTAGRDDGTDATFDSAGNAYLVGTTESSFPGFANAGLHDIFLARYNSAGTRTLLKQFGTFFGDSPSAVEVDASGNIYLVGGTGGSLGGQTTAGGDDAFLMKLDSAGNLLWTRLLGGPNSEFGTGLALDGSGHIWLCGVGDGSFGGHSNAGLTDSFVAEYDTLGNLLGTTFLATSENDAIQGLAIGPDGAAYVAGWTSGALGVFDGESDDSFVAKIVALPEPSALLLLAGSGLMSLLHRWRCSRGGYLVPKVSEAL